MSIVRIVKKWVYLKPIKGRSWNISLTYQQTDRGRLYIIIDKLCCTPKACELKGEGDFVIACCKSQVNTQKVLADEKEEDSVKCSLLCCCWTLKKKRTAFLSSIYTRTRPICLIRCSQMASGKFVLYPLAHSSAGTPLLLGTNLCEDSIAGSRTLPILRELPTVDVGAAYREFNTLLYHRVRQSSFNSIKIDLLNHQGHLCQLLPTIIVSCTSHFRRIGSLCDQGWSG